MKTLQHKLTIALTGAGALLFLLLGPSNPVAERTDRPAPVVGPAPVEAEQPAAPELAARPPRLGETKRMLAQGGEPETSQQTIPPPVPATPEEQIAALLSEVRDVSDPAVRAELVADLQRLETLRADAVQDRAAELGLPLLTEHGSLLVGFADDAPLYEISHNAEVATSLGADLVRENPPYAPDGHDFKIGLWDVYWGVTRGHDELGGIEIMDDAVEGGLHASHVAGTMAAQGLDPMAKGIAPEAKIWSFSSSNVLMELALNASVTNSDFEKLLVSVHPYGVASGWEHEGSEWHGSFSNDGDNSNDLPKHLGRYGSSTSAWDGTAAIYPFHLIVKSAGNHNDDNAPTPGATWYLNGQSAYLYDPASHPKSDRDHYAKPGYGTVDARASAKNVLTVGSVSEAVTGGLRDVGAAVLSPFSSTGPTDDGRIKPDLVASGENVYSVDGSTADQYMTASGTSMAAAGIGASAVLLQEIHREIKGTAMKAATVKGLLIHTADDLELPGPDYRTGWGLANVRAAAELLQASLASGSDSLIKEKSMRDSDLYHYFTVWSDGNAGLRVTLSWTDVAGNWTNTHDDRAPRLGNDLNLRVIAPDGTTVHYPYVMPFTSTWAESDLDAPATTGVNTVDNVEQIYLPAPAAGSYRVEIDYVGSLLGDNQKYSLIVSGTELGEAGVVLENPVADQSYMALDTTPITVANGNTVFTGSGHQYDVSWTPDGILNAMVDPAGNVTVIPTLADFGQVRLTLRATDSSGGTASDTFAVTLLSNIVRVDANTPADAALQNGTSWEAAYGNLQDALESAIAGQEIWVANGVYYPDERNGSDSDFWEESFFLPGGVAVYGGFTGNEERREERDATSRATILSGDLYQDDAQQPIVSSLLPNDGDWNNSYHVVRVSSGTVAILDGFVVTAGVNTNFFDDGGAGIWVEFGGELLLANCLISGNDASGNGGGLASDGGDVKVVKCSFVGNKAGYAGGGLALNSENGSLSHCEFRGNQASDGGAVYVGWSTMEITDCLFSGNTGFFGAGGIHVDGGWFKMVNSTMTGNSTFGDGGAIKVITSQGSPEIYNSIVWKNRAGGSEVSPSASAYGTNPGRRPYFERCLVANSGGSANWNSLVGGDGWNNIDADPRFVAGVEPVEAPCLEGDFALTVGSPAINSGNTSALGADVFDLDGDGQISEPVPVDLAGNERVLSVSVDLGAYEFGDLNLIDSDNDGLSDEFEAVHGGDLDPMSDHDGDGLTALAEFVHGLDPNAPLREPIGDYVPMDYLGTKYICMTYRVNPDALNFVNITVERRGDLSSPLGWLEGKTVTMSTAQSSTHPGMVEITCRSLVPFGQDGMEFLRIRHDTISSGGQTIPQSDPVGSTSVSGWNVWGQ